MSAPGTPKASQAAITAVQEALGCRRGQFVLLPGEPWGCGTHAGYRDFEWTERGCPVAVAAADAAAPHNAAQALEEMARELDDELYPADIFTPPTVEGARRDHDLLKTVGSTVDKYSAAGARNVAVILRARAADLIEAK